MDSAPQFEKRREGRARALEGLLASHFGQRPTQAGDKAIERLRAMSRASWKDSSAHEPPQPILPEAPPDFSLASAERPQLGRKLIPFSYGSWLAIAAAAALLAGGLAYWGSPLWGTPALAVLKSVPTGLIISREGVNLTPAKGLRIEEGDAILADAQSEIPAVLLLRQETVSVTIHPGASLQLAEVNGAPSIQVLRGRIEVDASRLRPGQYLELGTLQARAHTSGGRFNLTARLTSTWLEVAEGSVDLQRSSDPEPVRVGAQCYAVAALGLVLAPHSQYERWQTPYSVARPNLPRASP